MEQIEVSHREIYDRLLLVEQKVERIDKNTQVVVAAFGVAEGAFRVLEFIGKLAKPLLWIGAVITAVGVAWEHLRMR